MLLKLNTECGGWWDSVLRSLLLGPLLTLLLLKAPVAVEMLLELDTWPPLRRSALESRSLPVDELRLSARGEISSRT